ncbi:MAG: HEAT repeat domain-containing protein [Ruthenibacterium lactatiformans]
MCSKGKEDELVKLVHDRDKNVRLAAIAGLGRAGKDNACNVLITLLLDDDPEIRSASASALGDLGDRARIRFLCIIWAWKRMSGGSGHQGRCG